MPTPSAPRSLTWLRAAVLLWLGSLAGFAAGIEWIRTRPDAPPPPSGGIDLVGAGATFPYPLYRRWFAEYRDASGVRINYFSVGSGEGLRLLFEGSVDFGANDRPLDATERALARCGPVEIPTVVGAIAVVVNLPRIVSTVQLNPEALSAIFLGRITRWNDPVLQSLNPRLALPDLPIRAVQRARSSGTSAVFAGYLASSASWRAANASASEPVPFGDRVEGNEGVAAQVRAVVGAIGFVELSYAQQSQLSTVALENRAGRFVRPDAASLARTADELLANGLADTMSALVGARDSAAYPVAAITRLVVDRALGDAERGAHFLAFARWALREGAASATELGYVPLPAAELRRQTAKLDRLVPGRCPTPRTD